VSFNDFRNLTILVYQRPNADKEALPEIDSENSCREIMKVTHAMEALYVVVRCANSAYFARDYVSAYALMRDSLKLFNRLENRKAMAIAHNNLGNIMLAIYRYMQATDESFVAGLTKQEVVTKGIGYFREAIQLGEKLYDDFYEREGWSVDCLDFMQTLSNRYFNRAMFYLTVKNDYDDPAELEKGGLADIQIAKDMDIEIVYEGQQAGWNRTNRATKLFTVALSRARGHILIQEKGFPDDWEIDEVIDDALKMVKTEKQRGSSDLFDNINSAGRQQQIETELIKYKLVKDEVKEAAQVAIRMLFEDEYIGIEAQETAVDALGRYLDSLDSDNDSHAALKKDIKQFHETLMEEDATRDVSSEWSASYGAGSTRSITSKVVASSIFAVSESNLGGSSSPGLSRKTLPGDVRMEDF
jgi:hypothetical protein